jgi:alpha-glucosidase/alpha-D-xyloside xylohydrolase
VLPAGNSSIPTNGSLVRETWGEPANGDVIETRTFRVRVSSSPIAFLIERLDGSTIQKVSINGATGAVSFSSGGAPLFGLGEGGPQFDRRGNLDRMNSGQVGYRLHTHGGRVPIPLLIGTAGWAMFFHQPAGAFDLTGPQCRFEPAAQGMPLDIFFIAAREPAVLMREYAELTGYAEMPPLWALGYQQSHRTLASRDEVLAEARTFREKKLPCDALIYLGTGFCPSGWNTANGSFSWNRDVFPDPEKMMAELHGEHFKIALHAVILSNALRGTVRDGCELARFNEERASCYWDAHRDVFATGVDGWWPDEGDPLDAASRLTRIRMYWEGAQLDRPDERPYALHRNGCAGMQRYAAFLWSGDVNSTWETLRTHIPIAINTGLSGIPYWGTDIGGFVPTKELTGELYVRWFQFGAFCPLFRAHGRTWKLRLPWGWNTGDMGPNEIRGYGDAANPDPRELHNAQVEPVCRKYLELRYRLLPYLYSAVRECCTTGLPVIRGLWLHYPDDKIAVTRGDEYLWGRDMLVAPVTDKGATSRTLYLPRGRWYDFWTEEQVAGGREITRAVDLATMPIYLRTGAIVPLGPVKQYSDENVNAPTTLLVFPGADGEFLLYEDDGRSFGYRKGEWMGISLTWDDAARVLSLRLADGSRMLPPSPRKFQVRRVPSADYRTIEFDGQPTQVRF